VEKKTGERFGAKFSMPGMMDTVFNIGLNEKTINGLIGAAGDPRFVYDSCRRLIQTSGSFENSHR
jgi:pyruvate,orthophosphate dikinase